jgi:HSF-type DNA-binding
MMMNYLAPLQNNGSADAVNTLYTMQWQQPESATSSSSSSHLLPQQQQQQTRASSPLSSSNGTSEGQSPSSSATFPMKLHSMLTDSESLGFGHVVCWMGSQAFKVVDPHRFALDVMPMYFNQTKYKSFQRQ